MNFKKLFLGRPDPLKAVRPFVTAIFSKDAGDLQRFVILCSGFLTGLHFARRIGFMMWASDLVNKDTAIFSLGARNGEQTPAYALALVIVPVVTWGWLHVFDPLRKRLDRSNRWMLPAAVSFWTLQALPATALLEGLLRIHAWFLPFLVAFAAFLILNRIRTMVRPAPATGAKKSGLLTFGSLLFLYLWVFPGFPGPPFHLDWYHEGDILSPGLDFLHGKVPYRDIFVAHGLIHNVLQPAFADLLWGPSLASKKILDALLSPLAYGGLLFYARIILQSSWIWGLSLLCFPLMYPYFPFRHFFVFFVLALLTKYFLASPGRKASLCLLLAGFFSALQFWLSMEVGLFIFTASVLTLLAAMFGEEPSLPWKRRWIPLGLFSSGFAAPFLAVLAVLAFNHALSDFLWGTSLRLFKHVSVEGIPFKVLKIHFPAAAFTQKLLSFPKNSVWLWYVPLFTQFGALSILLCQWPRWSRAHLLNGLLLTLISTFMFFSTVTHGDFEHLSFSSPYSILLGLWLFELIVLNNIYKFRASGSPTSFIKAFTAGSVFGMAALYLLIAMAIPGKLLSRALNLAGEHAGSFQRLLQLKSAPLSVRNEFSPKEPMQSVLSAIQEHTASGDPLLSLTDLGSIYFMADRRNLSRYYLSDYFYDEKIEEEVREQLSRSPRAAILTPADVSRIKARPKRFLTLLPSWIKSHYQVMWTNGQMSLWTRKIEHDKEPG